MGKWTLEKLRNNNFPEDEEIAEYNDCYELAFFAGTIMERGYAIYKFMENDIYTMVLGDNTSLNPPVILSEEEALYLLNNPDDAKLYAKTTWLTRYR